MNHESSIQFRRLLPVRQQLFELALLRGEFRFQFLDARAVAEFG